MYNSAYRPASRAARRPGAALLATAALLAAAAPAARAADGDQGDEGTASAAVLRTALDVSLLNSTLQQSLDVTLNDVSASGPQGSAGETLLTARLDGVAQGEPFEMLRADVASAEATADADGSRAEVSLANARVYLPGLPALSLIELETVTASAVCAADAAPAAEANLGGTVNVLGEDVTLTAEGNTTVDVPGVGQVTLDLSFRETTETTAAASALHLSVSVDPLDLNVATVEGELTLAAAECAAPAAAPEEDGDEAEEEPATQTAPREDGGPAQEPDLATTGGGSGTPFLVGGALALVAAGGGTLLLVRRRAAGRDGAVS